MSVIYVCCEGITDVGVLVAFIEKCSTVKAICKTHNELKNIKVRNLNLSRKDKYKDERINRKAYLRRIAYLANENGASLIGYHQDAGRSYARVYRDINNDLSEFREKGYGCIAIVPKEMIESWILADEQAYENMFGKTPDNPALPKKPEEMWGQKENKDSNYPKNVMTRVLQQYIVIQNREVYAEIAENSNIEKVLVRCPKSFARFVNDMKMIESTESI